LQSFYDGICLLRQKYVKDPNLTVQQFLESQSKKLGKPLEILSFWRWKVGEGK
jgi:elongation factor Ts